ncbi:MAG: glycosyltransferase family 39 protein [Chloroflexota bacterium]|nr:MAG: glycosyltransferase family 39 protein [Chloroflexota bacterium]
MAERFDKRIVLIGLGVALSLVALLVLPPGQARQVAVFLLAWVWPSAAWSLWWDGELSERILIAAGTAMLLNTLLVLGLTYVPGATAPWALILGVLAVSIAPLFLVLRGFRPARSGSEPHYLQRVDRGAYLVLGLLLVAVLLRLPGMGYKELQGDEGVIMVRAATILTGDDAEWFNHQKGPAEIALPLLSWGIGESINEYWARMPFTMAGILVVLAVFWLGTKWFDRKVGLLAGLLFAVGGFGIAFSRIVQYQSLVMLWGALGLMMASRYRSSDRNADLVMACSFLAAGVLAHYDALLFAPAVLWLLASRHHGKERPQAAKWLAALAAAGFILLLFYLPFVLNPSFGRTFSYLLSDRVGVSGSVAQPASGMADAWRMMTFYNSIWYVLGLGLLAIIGLWVLARRRVEFAAVLYFGVPALFYLLVVRDPRTHVYTIFPGTTVLAGLGAVAGWWWIRERAGPIGFAMAAGAGIVWLMLVVLYPTLLFVDNSIERQRTWAENRPLPALYPVTWNEPPEYGLFGFPHQAGWRALGEAWPDSALPYGSNEEAEIADWYMGQAPRTHCQNAASFLMAANAQDTIPFDAGWLEEGFLKTGQIRVKGDPSMVIYARDPGMRPVELEATEFDRWLTPAEARRSQYTGQIPLEVNIGTEIRLLGYDLQSEDARSGGQLTVTLYWQALEPVDRNYQVFVHLYDDRLWAQHDGAPECGINPTTRWEPGQIVADPHIVELPADLPAGSIPLLVGMYDLLTEERLSVTGSPNGAIQLTEVSIEAS